MKKTIFLIGVILLLMFGIGVDSERYQIKMSVGVTGNAALSIWFDIVSNLIFMIFVIGLTMIVLKIKLSIFTNILLFFVGLFFSVFQILFPPYLSLFIFLPQNIIQSIQYLSFNTSLAGAFLLCISAFNLYPYLHKRRS